MTEYDVAKPLPPAEWLALDEAERHALVRASHERSKSPVGQSPDAHAAIHVAVEDRLAAGEAAVVRAYDRFLAAGIGRHVTVHALSSIVARHIMAMLEKGPNAVSQIESDADFDALDPASFKKP
jgi:hypothetical protein